MEAIFAEGPGTTSTRASSRTETSESSIPWVLVEVGQDLVLKNGNHRFAGTVDALTSDRNIIWVISRIGERRLFHTADGYDVFLQQPLPPSDYAQEGD